MGVRNYCRDTDFGAFWPSQWPWVKVMTHPLGHGQQLCEILSWLYKLVRSYGTDVMCTDGQTDRVILIYPPNIVCRGVITVATAMLSIKVTKEFTLGIVWKRFIIWVNIFSLFLVWFQSIQETEKSRCVCETLCPRWQQTLEKLFLARRSKSRSQGHWPGCHLKGHH